MDADTDLWVATATPSGEPHLVPLSFLWDGTALLIATGESTPTGRNLLTSGKTKVAIGLTRDVVLVEVTVAFTTPAAEIDAPTGDSFTSKTGFDPRTLAAPYRYFRLVPHALQAWREVNELNGRQLMRDGAWLV